MADDWKPIFVLPNIPLLAPIGCDITVLAPAHDPRVTTLKRAYPTFRRFLGRFSDNFGAKFEPTVLLVRADAPAAFVEVTTLASVRDLIAISAVAYNRALELRHPRGHRVMFGEAFAPWVLDKHFDDVIGSTPAILGTHEVAMFKGLSAPRSDPHSEPVAEPKSCPTSSCDATGRYSVTSFGRASSRMFSASSDSHGETSSIRTTPACAA